MSERAIHGNEDKSFEYPLFPAYAAKALAAFPLEGTAAFVCPQLPSIRKPLLKIRVI